jgi:hypothetical protein
MYAREEGYENNVDVGAHIIGNRFIDCVSYGSVYGSGFSFNISSNCPGAIIRDNFIQAICYNNQGSGVQFRNKDDAELGIVENNVIEIISFGNKGLNKSGNSSSWAGGLGMENDNSTTHNLIQKITGSVICFDNPIDVNTRGGTDCNITVYHPEGQAEPVLEDKSTGNNTIHVIGFNCSEELVNWCQVTYCDSIRPSIPEGPTGLAAAVVSTDQIDLDWTDNSDVEDGFSIEQKSGEDYAEIATVDKDITSFSVTGLSENTAYTFRVRAFNISGFSGYSNEVSGTTPAIVNTMGHFFPGTVTHTVFPNPFSNVLNFAYTLTAPAFVTICIYDPSGREIAILRDEHKPGGTHHSVLQGNLLQAGLFSYTITAGDVAASGKIIRQE